MGSEVIRGDRGRRERARVHSAQLAANESEVLTLIRFRVASKATGKEAAMNLHHYWRFREGKVERYRGSEDTTQTVATLKG
jgi:ketosteroid isomerase-like protein